MDFGHKASLDGRTALVGKHNPSGVGLNSSPEEARRASAKFLADAAKGGGFILGSGCFVPFGSPLVNLKQLVSAAHEYSY